MDPPQQGTRARAIASLIHDDNIYWEAERTGDFFLRLSPEIVVDRRSPTFSLLGSYTFDAERFFVETTETTPLARQRAALTTSVRVHPNTTVRVDAAYASTSTPVDFNLSTGLGPGRFRARDWESRAEVTQAINPLTTFRAEYAFTAQFSQDLGDIATQTFEGGVVRRVGTRDSASARFVGHRYAFDPGDTVHSEAALLGWVRKVTPRMTVNLEAGPRYALGRFRPEVTGSVGVLSPRSQFSLLYSATQTTAVGILNPIDVQRVEAQVTHRPTRRGEASLKGTVFRNSLGTQVSYVYRITVALTQPVTESVWFVVGYTTDRLEGNLYRASEVEQSLKRHVVSFGLAVVPWRSR